MQKITFRSIVLTCAISFFGVLDSQGQDIRIGLHGGVPVGDMADYSSFNVGADASVHFWNVTETLSLGVSTGYTHFIGKDEGGIEVEDIGYIPLAASARGTFKYGLFYTADIGYGIGTNDADSGLYYQGKFGWSSGKFDAFAFYRGISVDEIDVASFGAGVAFKVF